MTTVTQQKCACPDCVCIVAMSDAITKNGQNFCSEDCADGHVSGKGCGHEGCHCDGAKA